ncbi:porin [Burkholderia stagnalis]
MKRYLVAALVGSCTSMASAQSSVTLFGVVSSGVRWVSNTKGGNTLKESVTDMPNRFGLLGSEDIGGGWKVVFRLENGFNVANGAMTSANVLFSRNAYVGVDGPYGRVTLGRQLTSFEDLAISLDPLAIGGGDPAITPEAITVVNVFTGDTRFNNVVKYTVGSGGLRLSANYALGGVAGNQRAGANYAVQATYQYQTLLAGIGYQRTYNSDASQVAQNYLAGVTWKVGPVQLFLNYLGLLVSGPSTSPYQRRDSIPQGGISYQITPALTLTAAFYDDIASNLGNKNGASGHKTTAYAIAEYFLSKRTNIYLEIDRNSFSGAYKTEPTNLAVFNRNPASNATVGASVGLTTRF